VQKLGDSYIVFGFVFFWWNDEKVITSWGFGCDSVSPTDEGSGNSHR
jgi:hypothetical protein